MFKLLVFAALITAATANLNDDLQVVIIGAGAAGIAAATKLLKSNVTNIIVLEAEGRVGGRIQSVNVGSGYVDLGAEWCQEDANDAVYSLAKNHNVLRPSSLNRQMILSDGTCMDSVVSQKLSDYFSHVRHINGSNKDGIVSVGHMFMANFNNSVLANYETDTYRREVCLDAVRTYENVVNGRLGSYSWYEPSSSTDYESSPGRILDWNGFGFKTILEIMMESVEKKDNVTISDKILLNRIAKKIRWRDASRGLSTECDDGSTFKSKYVIFTPSVGVLRASHEQIFDPLLPEAKRTALNSIGYGNLIKVALHFPDKWWIRRFEGVTFIWKTGDLLNLTQQFPHGPVQDRESWLSGAYSLTPAENNENTLLMWFSGKFVQDMESTSDEIILNGTMFILTKFFGKSYRITRPEQMIRSSWYKNPNFLGVYVFESVESRLLGYNAIDKLAEPLTDEEGNPIVLFAGEGTSRNHYSLVRGAIESGYRAADRILSHMKTNKETI